MRFGLVGFGAWGKLHAGAITRAPGATLNAICCRNEVSAGAAAELYPQANIYQNWQQLIADADIDAVDVVVPNYLHGAIGIAALERGKHVLLEKPMATTLADCDKLIDAAAHNNRVLSVGHELRLSAQWAKVKELLDSDVLGTPRYANFSLFRFPFRPGANEWRYAPDTVGSWLLEEPVHFFDLMVWYFSNYGAPVAVRAIANSHDQAPGLNQNLSIWLRFENGAYATLTQSLGGFESHMSFELVADSGSLRTWWSGAMDRTYEPEFGMRVQRRSEQQATDIVLSKSGEVFELEEQIRQIVAAFQTGRALVSGEDARKAVAICLAAERSIAENREIPLASI